GGRKVARTVRLLLPREPPRVAGGPAGDAPEPGTVPPVRLRRPRAPDGRRSHRRPTADGRRARHRTARPHRPLANVPRDDVERLYPRARSVRPRRRRRLAGPLAGTVSIAAHAPADDHSDVRRPSTKVRTPLRS